MVCDGGGSGGGGCIVVFTTVRHVEGHLLSSHVCDGYDGGGGGRGRCIVVFITALHVEGHSFLSLFVTVMMVVAVGVVVVL